MTGTGLVSRSLSRMKQLMSSRGEQQSEPTARALERVRGQLHECAEGRGGEISTRQRAARLAETYLRLDDSGRLAVLRMIALEFGPDPTRIEAAHMAYQASVGTPSQWDAEAQLRAAMRSPRLRRASPSIRKNRNGVRFP